MVIAGPYLSGIAADIAIEFPDKTLLAPCFHDEPLAYLPEVAPALWRRGWDALSQSGGGTVSRRLNWVWPRPAAAASGHSLIWEFEAIPTAAHGESGPPNPTLSTAVVTYRKTPTRAS